MTETSGIIKKMFGPQLHPTVVLLWRKCIGGCGMIQAQTDIKRKLNLLRYAEEIGNTVD
jgi:hypothetical protein